MARTQSRKTVLQVQTHKETKKTVLETVTKKKKGKPKKAILMLGAADASFHLTSAVISYHVPPEANINAYDESVIMDFANVSLDEP